MTERPKGKAVVLVRWDEFDRLTSKRGWTTDAERARQLGISEQQLNHMRRGRTNPGLKVVDACLAVFGAQMYDVLFERPSEDAA